MSLRPVPHDDRRTHPRQPANLAATVAVYDVKKRALVGPERFGVIADYSAGGMRITIDQRAGEPADKWTLGDVLLFVHVKRGEDALLSLCGEVRWARPNANTVEIGMRFVRPEPQAVTYIDRWAQADATSPPRTRPWLLIAAIALGL